MKKLFTLAAAAMLFGTGIVGCSNTANGAAEDASKDTAAVAKAGATAVDKTVTGTEKAVNATETAAVNAADATKNAADKAVSTTEKAAANAVDATKDAANKAVTTTEKVAANAADATKNAADKAVAGTEKAVAGAGQVATHTGKVLTVTPTVKAALLRDDTLYPKGNENLNKINVDMDSDGQTVHLKGMVQTNDMKKKAEQIAKGAAKGDYKISNELTVGSH